MKKKRLKQWLAATMAATMVVTSAIASPVDVQAANKTVTVSTQKEFDKAVKQSGVKTIIVKSKTLKKLAVKSGNHSKITLKVDAPKVKIENKAKFAKVKIVDASSVTESKSGNTYVISDKKLSVTAKKSIKSITYSASKGTLTLSGAAKVSSVKVTKNDGSVIKNNTKNAITVVLADGTKKTVKSGKKLTAKTSTPVKETEKLSYAGYELKWQDDFNGDQLNRNDWNVELHEAGWVNNELQEYVDSSENIQVKDGNLYLKPVQKKNSDGTYSYTSGRVNTQGKHDFKYGLFEARVKVPKGKGYLPAFWMMPTNENVYGQWPKCGEIDCMEVMGQENNKVYGTIHFGDPHSERQNTYTLSEGNFTDEYHTFSCEWEPGKIKWYVDGVLYHTADDWYTTTTGQGTITYPAPFDQPFYMILNLAVGGSWVGYPDDKTTFDDQAFVIDYVKAYQKDSYDENVKKPVKNVELRKPDAKGNYINNGDFAKAEGLNDGKNWEFMTAQGGDATATIKNNEINIATKNEGTVDYSVQLVQANVPFEKGATYEVSFDASASAARTVKTAVKAPDFNYMEYMPSKTVELTTAKQHYSYEFQMKSDSDPNGRLEFNMGAAGSTADVVISNVAVKKIKEADKNAKEIKSVLADGNYVYNGGFQEGENRLGYWTIKNNAGAEVYVTNKNLVRELKAVVPSSVKSLSDVIVEQDELALSTEKQYVLSFDAYADEEKEIEVKAAGQTFKANVTKEKKNFKYEFETPKALSDKSIQLLLGAKGTTYIDNVRIAENGMIINGDFSAGMTGFVEWNHDAAKVDSYCVDTLKEKSAFCIDISDTGSEAWHIQLKQEGVKLEKGQTYKLTFDAKSTLDRSINAKFQRNGNLHNDDWTVYGEKNVSLTKDFQTYELTFKMDKDTDAESVLDFEFGAVGGKLTKKHTVTLDNIKLEKAEKSDEEEKKVETTPSYSGPSNSNSQTTDSVDKLDVNSINEDIKKAEDYGAIVTEVAKNTKITIIGLSGEAEKLSVPLANASSFTSNQVSKITTTVKYEETEAKTMGMFRLFAEERYKVRFALRFSEGDDIELTDVDGDYDIIVEKKAKEITLLMPALDESKLKNAKLVCYAGSVAEGKSLIVGEIKKAEFTNLVKPFTKNWDDNNKWGINCGNEDISSYKNGVQFGFKDSGLKPWDVQMLIQNLNLEKGAKYQYSYTIESSQNWKIDSKMQSANNGDNPTGEVAKSLQANTPVIVSNTFFAGADTTVMAIQMGTGKHGNAGTNERVQNLETPVKMYVTNVQIVKLKNAPETTVQSDEVDIRANVEENLLNSFKVNGNSLKPGSSGYVKKTANPGEATITIQDAGSKEADIEIASDINVQKGAEYEFSFDVMVDKEWYIGRFVMDNVSLKAFNDDWGAKVTEVSTKKTIKIPFVAPTNGAKVAIQLGSKTATGPVNITISNVCFKLVKAASEGGGADTGKITIGSELLGGIVVDEKIFNNSAAGSVASTGKDGEVKITISNSGTAMNDIQILKNPINVKEGHTYQYSFKAKADRNWMVASAMQIAKAPWTMHAEKYVSLIKDDEATVVSGNYTVTEADVTAGMQFLIQMARKPKYGNETADSNVLSEGEKVTVIISDLILTDVTDASGNEQQKNMLKDFSGDYWYGYDCSGGNQDQYDTTGHATVSFDNSKATIDVLNVGSVSWAIQVLTKESVTLENGATYKFTATVHSDKSRKIKVAFHDSNDPANWYGGSDSIALNENTDTEISIDLNVDKNTNNDIICKFELGKNSGDTSGTPTGKIIISNVKLVKTN